MIQPLQFYVENQLSIDLVAKQSFDMIGRLKEFRRNGNGD